MDTDIGADCFRQGANLSKVGAKNRKPELSKSPPRGGTATKLTVTLTDEITDTLRKCRKWAELAFWVSTIVSRTKELL